MTADNSTLIHYERAYGPFVHMSMQEKAIWLRFLQAGGDRFRPFHYDVRVGDGLQMPPGSSGYDIRAARALTTKRIDVIYFTGAVHVIVEVKVRAGTTAVGELITYRDLYMKTPGFSGEVAMLLVTDKLQPDMASVLESTGISWVIV